MKPQNRRLGLATVTGCVFALWAAVATAQPKPVTLEYFSWSIFRLTAPSGEVILTNPFVANPDSPVKVPDFPKVDGIVVADGHGDEVGSTMRSRLPPAPKSSPRSRCTTSGCSPARSPWAQVQGNRLNGVGSFRRG